MQILDATRELEDTTLVAFLRTRAVNQRCVMGQSKKAVSELDGLKFVLEGLLTSVRIVRDRLILDGVEQKGE